MSARGTVTVLGLLLLGTGLFAAGGAAGYLVAPAGVHPGPGPLVADPAAEIDRSRSSDAAPAAFRNRARLRPCGDVVLGQGDTIPPSAIACLARGGRELAVVSPTTEGDLIVTFYRTGSGTRGVDVFADTTRDRFGAGGWSRTRCPTRAVDEHGVCA